MAKHPIAIVLLGLIVSQSFAADPMILQSTRDSLSRVAEIVHPLDPAFQLGSNSKFLPLDTIMIHHNMMPFDSTFVVNNPSNVSAVYHIAPGREILVHLVVRSENTTVPYPVYYVNVAGDTRGKENDALARESWKNEKRKRKATDDLLKKRNKREISDSLYSRAMDSVLTEYYLTEYKLKDKYHVSSIGYVGAPELVDKIAVDTAAVLKAREVLVEEDLERILALQEQVAITDSLCTILPQSDTKSNVINETREEKETGIRISQDSLVRVLQVIYPEEQSLGSPGDDVILFVLGRTVVSIAGPRENVSTVEFQIILVEEDQQNTYSFIDMCLFTRTVDSVAAHWVIESIKKCQDRPGFVDSMTSEDRVYTFEYRPNLFPNIILRINGRPKQ